MISYLVVHCALAGRHAWEEKVRLGRETCMDHWQEMLQRDAKAITPHLKSIGCIGHYDRTMAVSRPFVEMK